MTKESSDISKFVGFIPVNRVEVSCKSFLEAICPYSVQFTKSFANKTVKVVVRPFLGTTLDYHIAHFDLQGG